MADQRIEGNFNRGWGIALLVVLLAVVANVIAARIHFSSYGPGNDVGHRLGESSRADNATLGH